MAQMGEAIFSATAVYILRGDCDGGFYGYL
jgi:hypothetical protein